MNKHTPGPWIYDDIWGLIKSGNIEICALHSGIKENAQLITAAPDMLELLEIISDFLNTSGTEFNRSENEEIESLEYSINSVIAQAKGEL